jgi:hypothetical protein
MSAKDTMNLDHLVVKGARVHNLKNITHVSFSVKLIAQMLTSLRA